jgi:hypothetical protein
VREMVRAHCRSVAGYARCCTAPLVLFPTIFTRSLTNSVIH